MGFTAADIEEEVAQVQIRVSPLFAHSPIHLGLHKTIHSMRARRKVTPLWDWSIEDIKDYLEKHPKKPPVNPWYQRGAQSVGCMLCPVPFIFIRDEIKAWYPKKVYRKGMELLVRGAERTGRPLLDTYLGKELSLEESL